jgi:hypothetical protein
VQVAAFTYSFLAASIFVRSDGEADVVALGPDDRLMYCWAAPGSSWRSAQISPPPSPTAMSTG